MDSGQEAENSIHYPLSTTHSDMQKKRLMIISIGIAIFIAILALAGFGKPLYVFLEHVITPIASISARAGSAIGRFFHVDASAKEANERVEELEARLKAQTVDYIRLQALEEENTSLRAQANFISEVGYRTLGARVISRAITPQTAAVTLDRGASDGVEIGQAVVTEDGIYVGKIISIKERTSVVMLLFDVRARAAATVAGSERVSGVIEGRGSSVAHFTMIPQAVPLERDDIVITAGTEEKVPANLLIGFVNDVESEATDPFKNAVIEPLVNIDQMHLVSVIIPGA